MSSAPAPISLRIVGETPAEAADWIARLLPGLAGHILDMRASPCRRTVTLTVARAPLTFH